jgi:hypothetical protein
MGEAFGSILTSMLHDHFQNPFMVAITIIILIINGRLLYGTYYRIGTVPSTLELLNHVILRKVCKADLIIISSF